MGKPHRTVTPAEREAERAAQEQQRARWKREGTRYDLTQESYERILGEGSWDTHDMTSAFMTDWDTPKDMSDTDVVAWAESIARADKAAA